MSKSVILQTNWPSGKERGIPFGTLEEAQKEMKSQYIQELNNSKHASHSDPEKMNFCEKPHSALICWKDNIVYSWNIIEK